MEGGPDRVWTYLQNKYKKEKAGGFVIETLDPLYADIEIFFNVLMDRNIPQTSVQHAYPNHYEALSWFTAMSPSSNKWLLESMLLTDMDLEEIAGKISPSKPILSVDVYKRAFFNVTEEHKKNLGWMVQYIWIPSMYRSTRLYFHDFIMKIAGFYEGYEMIEEVAQPGKPSPKAVGWIKDTALDQRMRSILASSGSYDRLPIELGVSITEGAIKSWEQEKLEASTADTKTKDLDMLMDALEGSIGVIRADETVPDTFHMKAVKYEDDIEETIHE